jgi:hypothetical protein
MDGWPKEREANYLLKKDAENFQGKMSRMIRKPTIPVTVPGKKVADGMF